MTAKNNNSVPDKEPDVLTQFSYRGLTFKIHRADTLCSFQIKQGNSIVSRMMTLPHKIEADIERSIKSLKFCIDRGWGANIDYSKVQEAEA